MAQNKLKLADTNSNTGTGAFVFATSPQFETSVNLNYGTTNTIAILDSSKNLISASTSTYPSLTELSYVKGVTSSIQAQINALSGALTYYGTWNASTNTPTLTSSTGITGQYYVVSVAGSTTLDGISSWAVGDWAIFNGSVWEKLQNGSAVSSVSGTTDRITSTGGATPVIDIASTYVGQSSITTLGTIGTGTWQGTVVGLAYGGTGRSLSDPGANAVQVWDDTTNAIRLASLSGLTYDSATNTLTASGGGGGVSDGTYGDITVTGSGATWTANATLISGKTETDSAYNDYMLFGDTSDSNNLKKGTIRDIYAEMQIQNPARGLSFYTDFMSGASTATVDNSMVCQVSGGSCTVLANTDPQHPGVVQINTGTGSTGRSVIGTATATAIFGGGEWVFETVGNPDTLSVATQEYALLAGFWNTYALDQGNGAFFLYDEQGNSSGSTATNNWQCVTASGSSRTFTTTSVAVSTSNWDKLKIVVDAAGSNVYFYINDTLVATHTTDIYTSGGPACFIGTKINKVNGTGVQRKWNVDYTLYNYQLTTAR